MNLSSYIAINIQIDRQAGVIKVSDTSIYPPGIANNIVGIVSITQPDEQSVNGNFDTPDIIYSGSLNTASKELRTQANGQLQQGLYSVTYQVDHPSYTPTTLTETFILSYSSPEILINEQFDVFTPSLKVSDDTDYSVGGFNTPAITRVWAATIGSVGSASGSAQLFDLIYATKYYDAAYAITLGTTLIYQHITYSFLTVKDVVSESYNTTANTPPGFTTLQGYVKTIKANLDNSNSFDNDQLLKDFTEAGALIEHIRFRICSGDTVNIYKQIQDFINIYHGHISVAYTNTNTIIPPYDLTSCNCGNIGGTTTDIRISNTDIANWDLAVLAINPDDQEYKIGTTFGAPTAGLSTFQNSLFTNKRVRLIRNGMPQSSIDRGSGEPYYTKPTFGAGSDTVTLFNGPWQATEVVRFEIY